MEASIMHLNRSKVRADAEEGHTKAQLLLKRTDPPDVFLAAMQIVITVIGLSVIGLSMYWASNIAYNADNLQLLLAASLIASLVILICSTIFAKRFAQLYATKVAYDLIKLMNMVTWLIYPLAKLFSVCVNFIIRLSIKITRKEDSEDFIEEDIRMMADAASETGAIDVAERKMIHNVFDFNTKTAEDISVHRTHISAIEIDEPIEEIAPFISEEKFTRVPVYENNLDNILGLLHTKDILEHMLAKRSLEEFDLRKMLREPYFVPSSKKVDELFVEMRNKQVHMVIVVDEYGGTVGLVTMEDIVEEIMGSILDEHDEQEPPDISKLSDNTYAINGTAMLEEVSEFFDELKELEIDVEFPEEDYDTLGGFLIGQLGHIPEEDEKPTIEHQGLLFKIIEAQEKRISKVIVTIPEPKAQLTQET